MVRALEVARRRWPHEDRDSALIVKLLSTGAAALEQDQAHNDAQRRARVGSIAGKYSELFGDGYLDDVRAGWDA